MNVEKLVIEPHKRFVGGRIGTYNGRWFLRFDLWTVGYRITFHDIKV